MSAEPPAPSVQAWLGAYAAELGVPPPSTAEIDELLALAAVAALVPPIRRRVLARRLA